MPTAPDTLIRYAHFLECNKRMVASSIVKNMYSIRHKHLESGRFSPTDSDAVRDALFDIASRQVHVPRRKRPIRRPEIDKLLGAITARPERASREAKDIRDRALLLLLWELSPKRCVVDIKVESLTFKSDGSLTIDDQPGILPPLEISPKEDPRWCAVRAIRKWIDKASISSGPLFREVDRHGNICPKWSGQSPNLVIKELAATCGLNPKHYTIHSFRNAHRLGRFIGRTARKGFLSEY